MYKIDFSNPSSIYFVGIGGISMSTLAELLAANPGIKNPNLIRVGERVVVPC